MVYDVTVVGVLFVALARFLATVSVERRRPSTKDGQPPNEEGETRHVVSLRSHIMQVLLGPPERILRISIRVPTSYRRQKSFSLKKSYENYNEKHINKLHVIRDEISRCQIKIKIYRRKLFDITYFFVFFVFTKTLDVK